MTDEGLIVTLVLVPWLILMPTIFVAFLGKSEAVLRLKKFFRGKKCYVLVKELRNDMRIHDSITTVDDNKIILEKGKETERTYLYDIKKTGVNKYGMSEAWFSEPSGKQLDPYEALESGAVSPSSVSKLMAFATVAGQMPKNSGMELLKGNLPWLIILGAGAFIVLALLGYGG